ncbi:MAG: murein biosynthesis integral membrane protein MurJ [Phycisphaerales bacterium]|jgi:putative peptidoglycan lipid II flippase|nr:murein biosynthesis integral membrane protein MurJ [Phycisphaerales bacterium]
MDAPNDRPDGVTNEPRDDARERPDAMHEQDDARGLGSAVRTFGGLTLVSRIAGLARDLATVRIFGDTAIGSAFAAAWAIPNLFRRLFGEGALAAAFVPEYARLDHDDTQARDALASVTVLLLTLVTSLITLAGEAIVLVLLLTLPPDPERDLSLRLVMVMLPFMPVICVCAILGGMLQVHGRFGPSAAAPILLNVFVIASAAPFMVWRDLGAITAAYVVGVASVLSGVAQLAWFAWALKGRVQWTRVVGPARDAGRRMLKRLGPVAIGLGTLQVNATIDTLIAMWPNWVGPTMLGRTYPLDAASNSILSYTQRLYQFPLGVFGIAVATAAFPALSRHARNADRFREVLVNGLRLSLFIGLPASVGLWLVREDLCAVMFSGGGGFSEEGVERAARVLSGYAMGVWAYSLNHVLTRGFYARGDTTTPMRVSLVMVAVNLTLNLTLIWPMGEAGLAWSTSISAMGQTVALGLLLRRATRTGDAASSTTPTTETRPHAHPGGVWRTLAATLFMAACVWGVLLVLTPGGGWWARTGVLAASCVTGGLAYLGAARALRTPELGWLLHRRLRA